jgi:hypothetical protein
MAQQVVETTDNLNAGRVKINENFTELYTDKVDTTDSRLSDARTPLAHNHDSAYSALTHNHDSAYAAVNHNHTGVYSPVAHNHDGTYSAANHNHDGAYAAANHNHDATYSAIGHTHNYAPALGADDNYVTDAEKVKLSNLSGVNTGDQDLSGKQNTLVSGTNIKTINGSSILGSGDLTVAGGSDPFTAKLILGSDVVTGANTTPVNLTGMTFDYEANATYVINIYASVTAAAATTGAGFGVNCSTAPSIVSLNGLTTTGATGAAAGWHTITNNAITATTAAIAAASPTNTPMSGMGFVKMGGTAGTAQFIFRSETTAAATCRAGSVITVMKVS